MGGREDTSFLDDGMGWENVAVGRSYWGDGKHYVVATLASSEDPINAAYLDSERAREYAAALVAAADEAERRNAA